MIDVREAFGFGLVAVQASILLPLIRHAARSRNGTGASMSGEAIWAVAGVGWLVYALAADAPAVIVSGTVAAFGSAAMVVLLWTTKSSRDRLGAVALAAATALGLGLPGLVYGAGGLVAALSVFGIVQFVPQFVESARHLSAGTPTPGTSVLAASMRALYAFGWSIYACGWALAGLITSGTSGSGRVDWPLAAWGLAGCVAFASQALAAVRPTAAVAAGTEPEGELAAVGATVGSGGEPA